MLVHPSPQPGPEGKEGLASARDTTDSPLVSCLPSQQRAPHHQRIAPILAPPPPTTRYYQLQAARALPQIDCFRDVAAVLVSESSYRAYRRVLARSKHLLMAILALGSILSTIFVLLELHTARVMACTGVCLLTPPIFVAFSTMRFDMLKLQVQTYEVWHVTISILLGLGLVAIAFADARASFIVVLMLGNESALLVDAHARVHHSAATVSALGSLALTAGALAFALDLLPNTNAFHVVTYRGWTLDATDVSVNAISTVVLLQLRNAYRIRLAARNTRAAADVSVSSPLWMRALTRRCFTYRTPVHLVGITTESAAQSRPRHATTTTVTTKKSITPSTEGSQVAAGSSLAQSECRAQMRYAGPYLVVDSHNVVLRSCSWWPPSMPSRASPWLSRALPFLAWTSLALMVLARVFHTHVWLAGTSLATAIVYILPSVALYNRKLLHRLLASFDFLFLSIQQWAVHLTMCVLLEWNERCALPLANALWMQWLITVDALTPLARATLGLTRFSTDRPCPSLLPTAVAVFHILDQLALCLELVFLRDGWGDVTDRALATLTLTSAHSITFRAIPFILTRMMNVFPWTCRLLARLLLRQHVNELVVLQGAVEYDDKRWKRHLERTKVRKPTRLAGWVKAKVASTRTSRGAA